jgi:hypothetical protein
VASAYWTSSTVRASFRKYFVVIRMIRVAPTPIAPVRLPESALPGPVSPVPVASTSLGRLLDHSRAARVDEGLSRGLP